jgi:surface carbohydrate biosynthesis protein
MEKNKHWLHIPVETKVRELHAKLLLAGMAAVRGFDVIIGSKIDINSRSAVFPAGIIFNVGLAENLSKNAERFKKQGHNVVAIDEEGLAILREELYLRHRVSKKTLSLTDMFFCWGENQASIIKKKVGMENCGKLLISGNPRFDMLRPEYRIIFDDEVRAIKEKYGKIILINTNFGFGNHFAGDSFLLKSLEDRGWMEKADDREYFIQYIKWQKKIHGEFLKIIPALAETYRDYNIIIRPHPSENHENWKKIEKEFPNVFAVHSGNVIPWLIAAEVLIHNGCTTAIEGYLLGTQAVTYRPIIEKDMEAELPNKVSIETYDRDGLINIVKKMLDGNLEIESSFTKSDLNYYISGLEDKTASELVVDCLAKANLPSGSQNINNLSLKVFEIISYFKKIAANILYGDKNAADTKYLAHKTSDIAIDDISDILNKLSEIHSEFSDLKIRRLSGTCHHIFKP